MNKLLFFIRAFYNLLLKDVSEWFFYKGKQFAYRRARKLAHRKFAIDGKTYFVIEGDKWVFFVGNSLEIDKLKRVRLFSNTINVKTLNEICCYKVGQTCPDGNDYSHRLVFNN